MRRTEEAFFASFFGVLLAGGVPVPIYPPFRLDRLENMRSDRWGILRNAQAALLITFDEATRIAGLLRSRVPSLARSSTVGSARGVRGPQACTPASQDPALIQYTSGSTGEPKGVLLSDVNLLANIRAIGEALDLRPDDVGVSWLPLYHDMGLIGTWLTALYFGPPIAVMSPLAFLSRPSRWLWSVHAHRGTVSPAPNFAYELCACCARSGRGHRRSRPELVAAGAERVRGGEPRDTIDRFTRRFAAYGFRADAMCPVYGLAESSVALTVPSSSVASPRIECLSRDPFQASRRVGGRGGGRGDAASLRLVWAGDSGPRGTDRRPGRAGTPRTHRRAHRVPRPLRDDGVLSAAGRHPRRPARRLDGLRRSRLPGGQRALHHRAAEGPHHQRGA